MRWGLPWDNQLHPVVIGGHGKQQRAVADVCGGWYSRGQPAKNGGDCNVDVDKDNNDDDDNDNNSGGG
jgi:hypothetical protein